MYPSRNQLPYSSRHVDKRGTRDFYVGLSCVHLWTCIHVQLFSFISFFRSTALLRISFSIPLFLLQVCAHLIDAIIWIEVGCILHMYPIHCHLLQRIIGIWER